MDTIDLSEAIVPFCLLQIVNQFKHMKIGETIEILGVDQEIIPDLMSVLPAFKFELIGTEAMNADSSVFRLRFIKIDHVNTDIPKKRCHDGNRFENH